MQKHHICSEDQVLVMFGIRSYQVLAILKRQYYTLFSHLHKSIIMVKAMCG